MVESAPAKLSPRNIIIDGALCAAAFALFYWLAGPHVPSEDTTQIAIWSAFCATCMTGVFWFALQMFKAVLRHQRAAARAKH